MGFPLLQCEYDDGSFDKDAQGWCSAWTRVTTDPATGAVTLRFWGDDNGQNARDFTVETHVARVFPELQLVKLAAAPWYFSLETNRLVNSNTDWRLWRGPSSKPWHELEWVNRALMVVGDLSRVATELDLEIEPFFGWPPRTTSNPWEMTQVEFTPAERVLGRVQYRPPPREDRVAEFSAWLFAPAGGANVVWSDGQLTVNVRGGLEHRPEAQKIAEEWATKFA